MYYSGKTYFLDQISSIGANLGVFWPANAKNQKFQKILFEPSSGTKMTPKMRGVTKICR